MFVGFVLVVILFALLIWFDCLIIDVEFRCLFRLTWRLLCGWCLLVLLGFYVYGLRVLG